MEAQKRGDAKIFPLVTAPPAKAYRVLSMDFEIETFVGAGPIRFGMTPQEVRLSLPGPVRSFKRTPSVRVPSDHFLDFGVIVNYKTPAAVDSIEFSRTSNPSFRGVALFNTTVDQAKAFLQSQDPKLEVDSDGFTSHMLGVGVYALMSDPGHAEPEDMVSIIAFEEGYYGKSA
jgi:hypothetical protein